MLEDSGLPLLLHDYSEERNPMSRALETSTGQPLPGKCLLSFMGDALEWLVQDRGCRKIARFHSEVRDFDIYQLGTGRDDLCLVQAPVGAPAAAMMMDLLIASGVRDFIACGGCGVTENLECGQLLVPVRALRDEGTSFHYAPPSPEIMLDSEAVQVIEVKASELGLTCSRCRVWTTDGFFRETPSLVERRRREGYLAIDMECSALAAVSRFYGTRFGALFYSGDSLADPHAHDSRDWLANTDARQQAICVAVEALGALPRESPTGQ